MANGCSVKDCVNLGPYHQCSEPGCQHATCEEHTTWRYLGTPEPLQTGDREVPPRRAYCPEHRGSVS